MNFVALLTCLQIRSDQSLSRVRLFATPQIVASHPPLFVEFSRHEYWSGLPFPVPGDLPDPGIQLTSPALQADSLPSEPPRKPQTRQNLISKIELLIQSPYNLKQQL